MARLLQDLWDAAIGSAQKSVSEQAVARESVLAEREAAVETRERVLANEQQTMAAHYAVLQEALTHAQAQVVAADERATRLDTAADEREKMLRHARERSSVLENEVKQLREKSEAASNAARVERTKLEERYGGPTPFQWTGNTSPIFVSLCSWVTSIFILTSLPKRGLPAFSG